MKTIDGRTVYEPDEGEYPDDEFILWLTDGKHITLGYWLNGEWNALDSKLDTKSVKGWCRHRDGYLNDIAFLKKFNELKEVKKDDG